MNACDPCNTPCVKSNCNVPCLRWGIDGCFLRGRCPDGSELDPIDLCKFVQEHETCTEFSLVSGDGKGESYMQFINECGEQHKIYACDFLGLGELECLGNVVDEQANPCDLLVFDPNCSAECSKTYNKWTHYTIPDAGNCVMEPDADGYYHVLVKDHNGCGCIKECKFYATTKVYEYVLRDSIPNDPDWPFTIGSRQGNNRESINLQLEKIPEFGKRDLEVTFQYSFGVQNHRYGTYYNFRSVVTPTDSPAVTSADSGNKYTKSIITQMCNLSPFGSWESNVSRTVIVPKNKKLFLIHQIDVHDLNANMVPYGGTFDTTPPSGVPGSSRLHCLRVFVRPVNGTELHMEYN